MNEGDFIKAVGQRLRHFTAATNQLSIEAFGMCTAAGLAARAGEDKGSILLRDKRTNLDVEGHRVTLNHQNPLRAGANSAANFLDGHTLESWAEQLDQRIFFWPTLGGKRFSDSIEHDLDQPLLLEFDSRAVYRLLRDRLFLSPINSGNATRRPTARGDWIYYPVTEPYEEFRIRRRTRGIVKGRDRVAEVSVVRDISPDVMAHIRVS